MALYRDHQLHDREPNASIDRQTKFSRARRRDNLPQQRFSLLLWMNPP
jgi:hypothetical protein